MSAAPLPLPRLAAYSLPAISLAALTLPLYIILPTFYAERIGLSPEGIGFALLIVRIVDAVNDPVIGWMADRWRPDFGRRRLWFLLSAPLAALAAFMLFWPPEDAGVVYLAAWGLILSIGYSASILPYNAWGAELATDYDGRSRVVAVREGCILLGTLIAIALPFTIGWADGTELHGLALMAIGIAIILPLSTLVTVFRVPEPKEHSKTRVNLREGIRNLKENRPFLRLALAFFLNGLGNAIAATLFLLYVSQRLELPDLRGPLLFVYFLCGILGVPLWTWLSKRTSKHRAWCIAMIYAMIVFSPAAFLPPGSAITFGIVCVLSGFALGADIVLPGAVQTDVIDVDTAQSGEQRSGVYFALWSLATKMSLAVAVGVSFPLLSAFGFSANANGNSTEASILLLAFLYAFGPIVLKIPAIMLMWNFPIGRDEVAELRERIEGNTPASA